RNAPPEFEGKGGIQAQPLVAAEESLESQPRSERTPIHVGPLEHADRARLLPERVLSTVLGLQTMQAVGNPFAEVHDIRHAIPARAFQEIRAYVAVPSGRSSAMDPDPTLQRCCRGNEQQDQVDQPPFVRVPLCYEFHRGHLPLLRPAAATG